MVHACLLDTWWCQNDVELVLSIHPHCFVVCLQSPPPRRHSVAHGDEAFIETPVTPKKNDKKEEPPAPSIHEEIVAAKDNIDQINRAIASIGGEYIHDGMYLCFV